MNLFEKTYSRAQLLKGLIKRFPTLHHQWIRLDKTGFAIHELVIYPVDNVTRSGIRSFINSILKSLIILALWFALSGAIYSRIALSFSLNRIFFLANENGTTVKQNKQSDFKAFFKITNHIAGKWKKKEPLFGKFGY